MLISLAFSLGNKTLPEDVCRCVAYDGAGPYCEQWWSDDPEWCYLKQSQQAQHCPGAIEGTPGVYYTEDEIVCNKSKSKHVDYF